MLLVIVSLLQGSEVSLEAVVEGSEVEGMFVFAYHAAQKAFQPKMALRTVEECRPAKKNPQKMMACIQLEKVSRRSH